MRVDVPRLLDALGVEGRKRGGAIWASCPHPDHEDRDPSWSILVVPAKQAGSHYCHGCEWGGGPLDLVMAVEDLGSIGEAARWVKARALEVDDVAPMSGVDLRLRSTGGFAFRLPFGVETGPLGAWVTPARRYAERRGLTPGEVDDWGLGYAVDGRLAGRIVFPIRDDAGRLLSYNARTFAGEEPRYMGPAEGEGASTGAVFGEAMWPAAADRPGASLVLCEGELNALACRRAGSAHVGALSGSSVDAWQVMKIVSFGEIVVATDLDLAGDKAAGQLRSALARHRRVRRARLPQGFDPADLWLRDPGRLRAALWG